MTYLVKEIFFTLQGEGANAGRPAVFCRFTGCNLWTGREEHRSGAICQFCDTDFVGTDGPGGGRFGTAEDLAHAIGEAWPDPATDPFVVCTGGEPLLQMDEELVGALKERSIEIAIETNGTLSPPDGLDWICVSPKGGADWVLREGNELKVVYPQDGAAPALFEDWEFEHFLIQPMDGPEQLLNTKKSVEYCLSNPRWRLSLQTHKFLGIP
ncbi:MAG: 7-carboxy-7-deazaguanine synthase [Acidobacteria bacterium]|jgi:7-carboxy-7-deazaguanine synthase (Cx14CxxC type)|nr:7-carboxy-7-deazaguanine synthase [Acidobacteriota bacterium]|tara:strand:- start:1331 stop:1963 length:633 start_codon:yes stop_codon:yes gene_type:complete